MLSYKTDAKAGEAARGCGEDRLPAAEMVQVLCLSSQPHVLVERLAFVFWGPPTASDLLRRSCLRAQGQPEHGKQFGCGRMRDVLDAKTVADEGGGRIDRHTAPFHAAHGTRHVRLLISTTQPHPHLPKHHPSLARLGASAFRLCLCLMCMSKRP